MKKVFILLLSGFSVPFGASAFCGFYVSKSDGTLKNKTSQVILARDGNKSKVTMFNDFKGNAKDFAMVVPVPVVLKKEDIKVVDQAIFNRLSEYSAARLVEYFDTNPCYGRDDEKMERSAAVEMNTLSVKESVAYKKSYGVKIEARYLVGEYDILILGAKESTGLKRWLTDNGYQIPGTAEEVLEPYIKSNMKFFVAKVNQQQLEKTKGSFLRPIQISFSSAKFILPIRLGMANADGDQDMIVYGLSRTGRMECTNYRNVKLPTGNNIPLFVKQNFNAFYGNLFNRQWNREGKNVAFLEYAWDVTPVNPMKCDPCVGNPPTEQELLQAGAWWLGSNNWNDYSNIDDQDFDGNNQTFFTRIHIRYNRNSFPQDLSFQVTPNREHYQARYVVTHPAQGNLSCNEGKKYLQELKVRRKAELKELMSLTGRDLDNWQQDYQAFNQEAITEDASYAGLVAAAGNEADNQQGSSTMVLISALMIGSAGLMRWKGII